MSRVSLTKSPPDPICPRVSIGGRPNISPEHDYYCTVRGPLPACIAATEAALAEMKRALAAGEELRPTPHAPPIGGFAPSRD